MGDVSEKCFWEFFFEVFGPIRGVGGDGFSMVFSGFGGWVSDRTNGGGSVGRSGARSVGPPAPPRPKRGVA